MSSQQCVVCECTDDSCESCKNPEECANCYSCCCTETHKAWRQERIHQGQTLEYLSVAWMIVEVVGSIASGILASSFALIAFGSDSLIELASALVVLRHLRLDDNNSKNQGERTALFTSLLLLALVPIIGGSSTYSFFVLKIKPDTSLVGLLVAIGAVVIMPLLWIRKRQIGKETACLPLIIDAKESATCFLMSLVLLGGLALEFVFHTSWIDYVAALAIVGFVAYEGKESFEEARDKD